MKDHLSISRVTQLDDALLRAWPLPIPSPDGDKEERGRVLVIAGSREMPGAVILAATAALRAGAGKLTIATGASVAQLVGLAIPESRVIELPETVGGGIAPVAVDALGALARFDAVLIGPGMQDESATCAFVLALLPKLKNTKVVLDACAMNVVRRQLQAVDAHNNHAQQKYIASFASPVLLTPHTGEMAHLTAIDKESVLANPCDAACNAARRWNALVALKGAATFIATPAGQVWRHEGGNIGLATSGSGDTLCGIITGLAARGASLEQACTWGVALHARAGQRLAERCGPLGYLARDIAAEVPGLMHALGSAPE